MSSRGVRRLGLLVALGVVTMALAPSGATAAAAVNTIVNDTGQGGWMCPSDFIAGATTAVSPQQEFVAGEILVRFRPWISTRHADRLLVKRGLSRLRRIENLNVHVLRLPPGLDVERAVELLNQLPEVAYAEPNYILHALAPARDATAGFDQWGLAKIQAPEAWDLIGPNPPAVLLATVDTGIDRTHPDLAANIWQNPGEIADNSIDDDGNGYIDDTWGWDFRNNDNDPFDDQMHGTLVSSIAAGVEDGAGVAGVCPWCQLVGVKVLGSDGSGSIDAVASGIIYAADIGARVINLSLGGPGSQALQDAVDHAWNQGALVVAGAGNDGAETTSFYPAAYANAMAIASTDIQDYRSCFSNYGEGFISVAAPGQAIIGAVPDQGYGTYSGTSLSTPHVTGLGGLLFSQDPARTNADVRSIIESTAEDLGPVGTDPFFGTGRVNAYRAVTDDTSATVPPAGLFRTDLTASGYAHARKLARDGQGTLHLVWHGQDGDQYQVLYATLGEDDETWSDPQVVFESSAETFHPALALDGTNVYIAFPSKHDSSYYRTLFTYKSLSGGTWSTPTAVVEGSYDGVRPDLYLDPSNSRLHLVASSLDNRSYVYYTWSDDGGLAWDTVHEINVEHASRYASVHAYGSNVTIAGRTVESIFLGLFSRFRAFTVHSSDDGNTWDSPTILATHDGFSSGEYGLSLAGVGDQLYLGYEHNGSILFRHSQDGVAWSDAEDLGAGAWPTVARAADGQGWVMWESDGDLVLRHYDGSAWEPEEMLGGGSYPNLKLGTSGDWVEWVATHCSGAPFRMIYGSRSLAQDDAPSVMIADPAAGQVVTGIYRVLVDASDDGAVAQVDLGIDGVYADITANFDGSTYFYDWDTTAYAEGTHTLQARATDDAAQSTTSVPVDVTVNNVADAPVAADDEYSTAEDSTLIVAAPGVLGNDIDADGDPLTASLDGGPVNGALKLNVDGSFAYTPTQGFSGADGFTYHANDGGADSNVASVTISVIAVNDPPVANDDEVSTDEDSNLVVYVLGNDTDPDSADTLSVASVDTTGTLGTVVNNGSDVTYDPGLVYQHLAVGESATDVFAYTISDGNGGTDTAIVTVTVTGVNDGPMAVDDIVAGVALSLSPDHAGDAPCVATVDDADHSVAWSDDSCSQVESWRRTAVRGSIVDAEPVAAPCAVFWMVAQTGAKPVQSGGLFNAWESVNNSAGVGEYHCYSDPDSGTGECADLSCWDIDGQPGYPTFALISSRNLLRAHWDCAGPDANGEYACYWDMAWSYYGVWGSSAKLIDLTFVFPQDVGTTDEDSIVIVDVLGNDSDTDASDTLSVASVDTTDTLGTVVNNGGDVTYEPGPALQHLAAGESATDAFAYTVSDGNGGADTAIVTVTVSGVNDDPVANDDVASTDEDVAVTIAVLVNDSDVEDDTLTVDSVTQPTHGTAAINPDNTVTYSPDADFNGTDTFTYVASDGNGGSATATVAVTVNPVNEPPVAMDDPAITDEDVAVTISVLANDSDGDGDGLFVDSVTQPANGTAVNNGNDVTYTPDANFCGEDGFTYTASDGAAFDSAAVVVAVTCVNDPPVANDDTANTDAGVAVTIGVLANDDDVDGDSLSVDSVAQPGNGTAVMNQDDTVTYNPGAGFQGTDTFTYVASDGNGGSDTAAVTVVVNAGNNPPVAADDPAITDEDVAIAISVLSNDSDPDGDPLSVIDVSDPAHGTATVNLDDTITYTPDADFCGEDGFTYTASDGAAFDSATVVVTVTCVNDPPVANDDTARTDQNSGVTVDVLENDSDPDAIDTLSVEGVDMTGTLGTVVNNGDSVTYDPGQAFEYLAAGESGIDVFAYTVSDDKGGTDTAVVTVTVTGVSDGPAVNPLLSLEHAGDALCVATVDDSDHSLEWSNESCNPLESWRRTVIRGSLVRTEPIAAPCAVFWLEERTGAKPVASGSLFDAWDSVNKRAGEGTWHCYSDPDSGTGECADFSCWDIDGQPGYPTFTRISSRNLKRDRWDCVGPDANGEYVCYWDMAWAYYKTWGTSAKLTNLTFVLSEATGD